MKKLTFSELAAKGQFDLVVRRKHVRGNKCHSGDECPAARAAIDAVDMTTLASRLPVWVYPEGVSFAGPNEHGPAPMISFSSVKLKRAINRYDRGKAKFPVGIYRLKRVW